MSRSIPVTHPWPPQVDLYKGNIGRLLTLTGAARVAEMFQRHEAANELLELAANLPTVDGSGAQFIAMNGADPVYKSREYQSLEGLEREATEYAEAHSEVTHFFIVPTPTMRRLEVVREAVAVNVSLRLT